MDGADVTMVRIYITEGERRMQRILARLHDEARVRGVTVFRGVTGFGRSGRYHASRLVDLAMDLPLVIEFFDTPERVAEALAGLGDLVEPGHVVWWPARVNEGQAQPPEEG